MTLEHKTQQESRLQSKIKEILIDIRSENQITLTDIASRLGVANAHFNKVANGKKKGSRQLLMGLEMLRHVLKYPAYSWPDKGEMFKTLRRCEASDISLEDFFIQCAIRYGDKVADEIQTQTPRQVILHNRKHAKANQFNSDAPSDISKRVEDAYALRKKKG